MSANLIEEAERKLGLNATHCPAFLGVSKGKWSDWKNGHREIPDYVRCSIESHMALSKRELQRLKKARDISAG